MAEIIGYNWSSGDDISGDDASGDEMSGDEMSGDEMSGADIIGLDMIGADDLARLINAAVSGDDVSGADIIGAARRGNFSRNRGRSSRQQQRRPAQGQQRRPNIGRKVELQQEPYTKIREYPMGFVSATPVAAGATQLVTQQPQVPFRGDRLVISSDIAGIFVLNDIKVGKNSQLPAAGAIAGRTFQENAVSVRLGLDTASVSMIISISVTNISGAPATFFATLIGTALE